MKQAIVIDSSREIPQELLENENIYPVGYLIEDSKGAIFREREHIKRLQTENLVTLVNKDRKARIYSPSIKDFVELYTFLAEEYESLISIHSSYFTPIVFEHALLAKKMVSGLTIDLIDSQTMGPASGLFTSELIKFIPGANNINDIRKKAIDLNKHISSYTITTNEVLVKETKEKSSWMKGLPFSSKNFYLYHYFHTNWDNISSNKKAHHLFKEMNNRISITNKTKEINQIYYSSSSGFMPETKDIVKRIKKIPKTETTQSLISRFLLGRDYSSIAFL